MPIRIQASLIVNKKYCSDHRRKQLTVFLTVSERSNQKKQSNDGLYSGYFDPVRGLPVLVRHIWVEVYAPFATRQLPHKMSTACIMYSVRDKGVCNDVEAFFAHLARSGKCSNDRMRSTWSQRVPKAIGAICPTCHRRIHSGEDGLSWNRKLQERLKEKEELSQ
jgi:hypothetical protein